MNGYKALSDMYKRRLSDKTDNAAELKRKIKALEILAESDKKEQYELFNSGAFNDIVKGYILLAINETGIDKSILDTVSELLNTTSAEQAETYYKNN